MANSTEVYLKKSGENNLRERKEGSIRTGRRGGRCCELTAPPLPTAMGGGRPVLEEPGGKPHPSLGEDDLGVDLKVGGCLGVEPHPSLGRGG